MKKKFDFRRVTAFLLCLLLCGVSLPQNVSAAKLEEVESCTLDLSYTIKVGEEEQSMENVEFRLYRVAEITDAVTFRRVAPFDAYAVTASDWLSRAATLAGYVARDKVEPTASAVTNGEGKVFFEALLPGLYLIVGDSKTIGDYRYTPTPFLLSLPYTEDGVSWEPNVVTFAKYTRNYIGGGGGPDPKPLQYHVLKVWEDKGNEESRPQSVTVDLLRNGEVYDSVELSAGNNWRHDWTNLSPNADWQVTERAVEGYTASVSQSGITFVITNTLRNSPPHGPGETPSPEETPPPEEDLEDWEPPLGDMKLEDPPQEEELEDNEVPLANLPQTGQLWWPVPILAMGGVLLMFLGFAQRRRWSAADDE